MQKKAFLPLLLLAVVATFSSCRKTDEAPGCYHEDWACNCPCTEEYAPVCGCNNVTYGNECNARVAGYEVKHVGECGSR